MAKNSGHFACGVESSKNHGQDGLVPSGSELEFLMEELVVLISLLVINIGKSEGRDVQTLLQASLPHEKGDRVLGLARHEWVKTHILEHDADVLKVVVLILRYKLFVGLLLA